MSSDLMIPVVDVPFCLYPNLEDDLCPAELPEAFGILDGHAMEAATRADTIVPQFDPVILPIEQSTDAVDEDEEEWDEDDFDDDFDEDYDEEDDDEFGHE